MHCYSTVYCMQILQIYNCNGTIIHEYRIRCDCGMHTSRDYFLSSFIRRRRSGIFKSNFYADSFVTYLKILGSPIFLQLNSHDCQTTLGNLRDEGAFLRSRTEISNLHTVHVHQPDIYLEDSDWFLLLTQIYSHQSETLSVVVTYVINMECAGFSLPVFLRIQKTIHGNSN